MNNKEYFEKSIIPYRKEINKLKSENNGLIIENFKLQDEIELLKESLLTSQEHIERLLEYMEMDKKDLLNMIEKDKAMSKINGLFNVFKFPYL